MGKVSTIAAGTYVGFSGNKTVAVSKTETATNRVNITEIGELYFNGARIGTNEEEEKFLNTIDQNGKINISSVLASNGQAAETYFTSLINNKVAGAYKFGGSINTLSDAFQKTNVAVGTVFNVKKAFTILGGDFAGKYPAGTNVAVNTAYSGNGTERCFDPLGGIAFDASNYVTSDVLTTTLASYVTSTSLTTTLASYVTNDALATKLGDYKKAYLTSESSLPEDVSSTSMPESQKTYIENLYSAIRDGRTIIIKIGNEANGESYVVAYDCDVATKEHDICITLYYRVGNTTYKKYIETLDGKTGYTASSSKQTMVDTDTYAALQDRVTALEERLKLV